MIRRSEKQSTNGSAIRPFDSHGPDQPGHNQNAKEHQSQHANKELLPQAAREVDQMFAVWAANLPAVIPRAALKGLAAFWAGDSNFGHGALRQRHEKNKKTKPLQTICLFF